MRVQSDPAGRLVITGHPEEPDNPWGVTPFRKVRVILLRILTQTFVKLTMYSQHSSEACYINCEANYSLSIYNEQLSYSMCTKPVMTCVFLSP